MNTNNFTTQVVAMQESLLGYAHKLTRNSEDAKDLVQETMFKALCNETKFESETNIKAWAYTIMKNTFINEYRRKSKRGSLFSADTHEYIINNKPTEFTPENDYNYKELSSMVNSLEPEFRVPFQMHEGGFKYQEIADELGINVGTIKSRIHFSRRKLIEKIEPVSVAI